MVDTLPAEQGARRRPPRSFRPNRGQFGGSPNVFDQFDSPGEGDWSRKVIKPDRYLGDPHPDQGLRDYVREELERRRKNKRAFRTALPPRNPAFGLRLRRPPRLPLRFPLDGLLDAADLVEPFFIRRPVPQPNPAGGWYLYNGPCDVVVGPFSSANIYHPVNLGACITGQGILGAIHVKPGNTVVGPGLTDLSWSLWRWNQSVDLPRYSHKVSYRRANALVNPTPPLLETWALPMPSLSPAINPNLQRNLLAPPELLPDRLTVGAASVAEALIENAGRMPLEQLRQHLADIAAPETDGWGAVETFPPLAPGSPAPPPLAPHTRQPPPPRTKEIKARGATFVAAMAMDAVSEWAEVVDALFQALPDPVKDRWSKGRHGRGMADNAGQYGVDGADWKAQAVWHNAHLVDPVDFLRNLIANHLEDKLIGGLHKHLPRNMINAAEDGQIAYAKLVKRLLESIGLGD